jgi:methylmalonyl-CoA mutase
VIRSSEADKHRQIDGARAVRARDPEAAGASLAGLQRTAIRGDNTFGALIEAAKHCTIGQISGALYDVGGRYRRNM